MLKIKQTSSFSAADILILPLFEQQNLFSPAIKKHFKPLESIFKFVKDHKDFSGKCNEMVLFHTTEKKYPRVLLLGLGKEKDFSPECLRRAGGVARKKVKGTKAKSASCVFLDKKEETSLIPFLEGFLLANYSFENFKSGKKAKNETLKSLDLITSHKPSKTEVAAISETVDVIQGVFHARDLVNTPANALTPDVFAKEAKKIAKSKRIKITIVDEKKLKKIGAGAITAVGQGAENPPRFVILEYKSKKKNAKTVSLVGKGITFDTGGINLKPTGYIETMKCDMGGAAAVLGTFSILAKHDVPVNVVGVLALAENAIGSKAIRPGDYIKAYNGKTIEIINTDAEGRLVLADALAYVQDKYKLDSIIDLATLTGACLVALGYNITAVLTHSDVLLKQIQKASEQTGEKVWQLPMDKDLLKAVKGEYTDLLNYTGSVKAGTIMGAAFLNAFVKKGQKWAHLDIAGTGWADRPGSYCSKGGTGAPIRLLWKMLNEYK